MKLLLFFSYLCLTDMKLLDVEKKKICSNLNCDKDNKVTVCGIRTEGNGFRLKLFKDECELLKYGCLVDNSKAYGVINLKYCEKSNIKIINDGEFIEGCDKYDCSNESAKSEVCGIRQEGHGFKVRLFHNECQLLRYNCENKLEFIITDYHICNGLSIHEGKDNKPEISTVTKQLIVVDGTIFNRNNNINDTVENFFAATHVFDMPMQEIGRNDLNETARRMLLKIAGPVKVFKPWITIPKNISDDYFHRPTLSSCYHKCPIKCPETYAPVCGVPGIVAREPSIMFRNHCFMDVAQCKMQWENKSPTALSSFYIESSFLFCLGDEMNGLYRFLPLIRTLQHMGRLKKKGHFRYKLTNMRFFNNLLSREPKLMG